MDNNDNSPILVRLSRIAFYGALPEGTINLLIASWSAVCNKLEGIELIKADMEIAILKVVKLAKWLSTLKIPLDDFAENYGFEIKVMRVSLDENGEVQESEDGTFNEEFPDETMFWVFYCLKLGLNSKESFTASHKNFQQYFT